MIRTTFQAFASIPLAMLLMAQPAISQPSEVETCFDLPDATRLPCYDRVLRPTVKCEQTDSRWESSIKTSQMDDSQSVFLTLEADEPVIGSLSNTNALYLIIRCVENTTSLILSHSGLMFSDIQDRDVVRYRVDDQPPREARMSESTSNRALGLWNGGQSIPVIKSMLDAQKFLVRFVPVSRNPIEASFSIAGLAEEITPLRETCGW